MRLRESILPVLEQEGCAISRHSRRFSEATFVHCPEPTDSVEEVGDEAVDPLAAKRLDRGRRDLLALSGSDRCPEGADLGQFPEVLGDGCKVEFIAGTTRAAQSQPIELQDALEVREQHLHLLPLIA